MSRKSGDHFSEPSDPLRELQRLHHQLANTAGAAVLADWEIVRRALKLANDYAGIAPADLISPEGFISLGHNKEATAFFNRMPPTVMRKTWESIEPARIKF